MSKYAGEQLSSTTVSEASTAVTSSTVDNTSASKVSLCVSLCGSASLEKKDKGCAHPGKKQNVVLIREKENTTIFLEPNRVQALLLQ